jgi:hypothetical protein
MLAFAIILFVIVVFQTVLVVNLYKQIEDLKNTPLDNRARDSKGRFVANDPSTPENEAYKKRK